MKPETQTKLKFATAEVIRSVLASSWFWKRLPPTRSPRIRKERTRLRRAAEKARGDPVRFVESVFGSTFFATDSNLRESAANPLSEILAELARWVLSSGAKKKFLASKESERRVVVLFHDYFGSLASRPGRPQKDKYRNAAATYLAHKGKISCHRLCMLHQPGYHSMDRKQQEQARKQMYAGVHRILKQAATRSDEIPISVS